MIKYLIIYSVILIILTIFLAYKLAEAFHKPYLKLMNHGVNMDNVNLKRKNLLNIVLTKNKEI